MSTKSIQAGAVSVQALVSACTSPRSPTRPGQCSPCDISSHVQLSRSFAHSLSADSAAHTFPSNAHGFSLALVHAAPVAHAVFATNLYVRHAGTTKRVKYGARTQ